jgi:hypothetical protein
MADSACGEHDGFPAFGRETIMFITYEEWVREEDLFCCFVVKEEETLVLKQLVLLFCVGTRQL